MKYTVGKVLHDMRFTDQFIKIVDMDSTHYIIKYLNEDNLKGSIFGKRYRFSMIDVDENYKVSLRHHRNKTLKELLQ